MRVQVPTPEGLTASDLDNIRLTAQFVARNGKAFLSGLATKEAGNLHFNFLKPTHSLFGYFSALCEAYQKVLLPPKGVMDKLRRNCTDRCGPLPPTGLARHRTEPDRDLDYLETPSIRRCPCTVTILCWVQA